MKSNLLTSIGTTVWVGQQKASLTLQLSNIPFNDRTSIKYAFSQRSFTWSFDKGLLVASTSAVRLRFHTVKSQHVINTIKTISRNGINILKIISLLWFLLYIMTRWWVLFTLVLIVAWNLQCYSLPIYWCGSQPKYAPLFTWIWLVVCMALNNVWGDNIV